MDTINIMKKLINEKSLVQLRLNYDKFSCCLKKSNSDYSVEIIGLYDDTLVIKCDNFPDTTIFFKNDNKECKRADYVIVSSTDKKIIIIELKRSKSSAGNSDIIAQLKGGKCVIDYCETIAGAFLDEHSIFKGYECLYFKYRANIKKRSFSSKADLHNDTPEHTRILDGKKVFYGKLVAIS